MDYTIQRTIDEFSSEDRKIIRTFFWGEWNEKDHNYAMDTQLWKWGIYFLTCNYGVDCIGT
jgi:hypothetical protein